MDDVLVEVLDRIADAIERIAERVEEVVQMEKNSDAGTED